MQSTQFLLPFVHGLDKFAIEQAILLSKSHNATLVPLVLIQEPEERRKKGVRLEYLQQSMDFLEAVKQKANRYSVQIEKMEIFTKNVVQSINLVASEIECEGILLYVNEKGGILLQIHQIKSLMESPPCKLYITHLPVVTPKSYIQMMRLYFSQRLPGGKQKQRDQIADRESGAEFPIQAKDFT